MKARVRKTGEIVDVIAFSHYTNRTDCDYVSYIDSKGVEHDTITGLNFYWDFEPIENITDIAWEQRRYEIAKVAMQGILSNQYQVDYACCDVYGGEMPKAVAKYAVTCADALIEELKKDNSGKED